jgi:NitT/TauT family transport system permease protein
LDQPRTPADIAILLWRITVRMLSLFPRQLGIFLLSLLAGLCGWSVLAALLDQPLYLPSPLMTWRGAVEVAEQGILLQSIGASLVRILIGWSIGSVVGIPLGLAMGHNRFLKTFMEPYVEFFRFIPPIAFITLAVVWFGLGETSKIVLIVWTTFFMVAITTMVGVLRIEPDKLYAARSLGANNLQCFLRVEIPATIPHMATGMKLAMGNSFMTVVAAEMIGANSGIGWLIFDSRLYLKTDWIFVGIITLGTLGFLTDQLFRALVGLLLRKYDVRM